MGPCVRRDDGERVSAYMVRDGACAPPHHEGLAWRRLLGPHPEERASRASRRMGHAGTVTYIRVLAAHGVRVLQSAHPRISKRAQGRPGALRTHGPRATKKHAAEPQVRAGTTGLPCAMVLTAYYRALPGETGLCCHRRFASSRKTSHLHRGARTTRLRRPRHVVRQTTHRVHRIPLPTSVTIAKRPSCGSETRE